MLFKTTLDWTAALSQRGSVWDAQGLLATAALLANSVKSSVFASRVATRQAELLFRRGKFDEAEAKLGEAIEGCPVVRYVPRITVQARSDPGFRSTARTELKSSGSVETSLLSSKWSRKLVRSSATLRKRYMDWIPSLLLPKPFCRPHGSCDCPVRQHRKRSHLLSSRARSHYFRLLWLTSCGDKVSWHLSEQGAS